MYLGGMDMAALFRRLSDPRDVQAASAVAVVLLAAEAVLCCAIVLKVPYTEIDWIAYMEEVGGFLGGELDYKRLGGGTGPLVYPAGFVWLYSGLHWLTNGGDIPTAQVVFIGVYLATQAVVMAIYVRSRLLPPWALSLLCLSKRLHSIFVLRLFNDCFAMLLAYCGVLALTYRRVTAAVLLFSAGVSVKMNVLLMAPPVLALCLLSSNPPELLGAVALGGALQAALAVPFLASYPWSYLSRAFELSRVFQHKWTVNLKFLDPETFASPSLASGLLALHVLLLLLWAARKWFDGAGGPGGAFAAFLKRGRRAPQSSSSSSRKEMGGRREGGGKKEELEAEGVMKEATGAEGVEKEATGADEKEVEGEWEDPSSSWPLRCALVAFSGNLIGIATARTLHYQFYAWYFHTLPLLLWAAAPLVPTPVRLALLGAVEWAFNVFPATPASSAALTLCHAALVGALWFSPAMPSLSKGTTAAAGRRKAKET